MAAQRMGAGWDGDAPAGGAPEGGGVSGYAGRCPAATMLDVLAPEDAERPLLDRLCRPMAPLRTLHFQCAKSAGHAGPCLAHLPGGAVLLMRRDGR